MKIDKLKVVSLVFAGLIMQGTCALAASSSEGYGKEELDNLQPGWSWIDKDKSNYRVNSYKNTFSSIEPIVKEEKKDEETTMAFEQINQLPENVVQTTWGNSGLCWARMADKSWMLLNDGVPQMGWKLVNGKWYYMNSSGIMQTGWINDNGTWYYLYESGEMASNTYIDGYYLGPSGSMVW